MSSVPQVIAQRHCKTGENPLWDPDNECIYWTDIPAGRIYSYHLRSRETITLYEGPPVGGFTLQADGSLLLFRVNDIARRFPDGRVETVIPFPEDGADRFNDVIADPEGRVFAGRMAKTNENGALFRIDRDGSIHRLFNGCACPNGMGFSPDNSIFYFTCTTSKRIYRFRYNVSNGELTDREVLYSAGDDEGLPDGLTVDRDGNLWSARFNGSRIVKLNPAGKVLEEISVPTSQVTSVAFGGPDLDTIYITSGGGEEKDDSDRGALFALKVAARGRPEFFLPDLRGREASLVLLDWRGTGTGRARIRCGSDFSGKNSRFMPFALFLSVLMSALIYQPLGGSTVEVLNRGVGGNNSRHLLKRLDADVLAANPDLVILMVGTNDMLNSGAAVPLAEYAANLRTIAEKIRASGAEIILMTIPPCLESALFSRHPRAFYEQRSPAERIADANAEVVRLAKEIDAPVIDVHRIFGAIGFAGQEADSVLRNLANSGVDDGVHPTPAGYRLIATALFQQIQGMSERSKRIVCFGDSITYGHGAEDAGTAKGETYPGFLAKLLTQP